MKIKLLYLIILVYCTSCGDRILEDELNEDLKIEVKPDYYTKPGLLKYIDITSLVVKSEKIVISNNSGNVFLDQDENYSVTGGVVSGKSYYQTSRTGLLYRNTDLQFEGIDTIKITTDYTETTIRIHVIRDFNAVCNIGAQTDFLFIEENKTNVIDVIANDNFCIDKENLEIYKDVWFAQPVKNEIEFEVSSAPNGLSFRKYFVKDKRSGHFIDGGLVVIFKESSNGCKYTLNDDSEIVTSGTEKIIDVLINDEFCKTSIRPFPSSSERSINKGYFLTIATPPSNGKAVVVNGQIKYISNPSFKGLDEMHYFIDIPGMNQKTSRLRIYVE